MNLSCYSNVFTKPLSLPMKVLIAAIFFLSVDNVSLMAQPSCTLDNVGMSKWYGDADSQNIGDSSSDDEDDDDFISFVNFGSTDVDISGWELYVDQVGLTTPAFTFPSSTILVPNEEVTVISDWNEGPALPTNWFDANLVTGEGMFEETSNDRTYAILRDPIADEYITLYINEGNTGQSLSSGTKICEEEFTYLIENDFNGCEMAYWDIYSLQYTEVTDCSIPEYPSETLPVEWGSFEGTIQKSGTIINWETSIEQNNHYFAIERAFNGGEFEEIGRTDAAGNSTQVQHYQFVDQGSKTLSYSSLYYRIRQVDFNGNSSLSKTLELSATSLQNSLSIDVFPNVVDSKLNIQYQNPYPYKLEIKVLSPFGKLMKESSLPPTGSQLSIDTENWPSGIYFILAGSGIHAKFKVAH
jgi:hypothetical protein